MGSLTNSNKGRPKSKTNATPRGNSLTEYGGGFSLSGDRTVNLGGNVVRDILAGKIHKNIGKKSPDLLKYLSEVGGKEIPIALLNQNKGLLGKGVIKENSIVENKSEEGSRDYYDTAQELGIKQLQGYAPIMDQINSSILPSLLQNAQKAIGQYQSMIGGVDELDPRIQGRINSGVDAYINNKTSNMGEQYRRIADGLVNDISASGIGGLGAQNRIMMDVNEPLAQELGNITNDAEIFRQQLTNDALSNSRQGLATLSSTAPALNQILSTMTPAQLPYNSALANPTGNFDPALLAQMLQFGNSFALQKDQYRSAPYDSAFPSALTAEMTEPNAWGSMMGSATSMLPLLMLGRR
jgi:hypothetical protein